MYINNINEINDFINTNYFILDNKRTIDYGCLDTRTNHHDSFYTKSLFNLSDDDKIENIKQVIQKSDRIFLHQHIFNKKLLLDYKILAL